MRGLTTATITLTRSRRLLSEVATTSKRLGSSALSVALTSSSTTRFTPRKKVSCSRFKQQRSFLTTSPSSPPSLFAAAGAAFSSVPLATHKANVNSIKLKRVWDSVVVGMMAAVLITSSSLYFIPTTTDNEYSSSHRHQRVSCEAAVTLVQLDDVENDKEEEEEDTAASITASTPRRPTYLQRQPCQKVRFIQATSAAASSAAATTDTASATPNHNVSFRSRWFNNSSSTQSTSSSNTKGEDTDWMSFIQSTGKPYDVSVRAIRGGRYTMEDEYFVANGGRFAAVFDGHGGSGVAQFLKKQLYPNVSQFLKHYYWEECDVDYDDDAYYYNSSSSSSSTTMDSPGEPSLSSPSSSSSQQLSSRPSRPRVKPSLSCHVSALRAAFEKVEQDVIMDDNLEFQGSTAVAVLLVESEDGHRTLLSANVGDSRAVLSRKGRAVELTHDHKPNDEKEKARIMAMGETIEWDQDCKVHRVRNLSLARAIGDRYAKPAVSPEVEIQHFPVMDDQDEFVIVASDGLWDVMSSQDAVSFVHNQMKREMAGVATSSSKENKENYQVVLRRNMAKFLAREAIRKGSSDNVSVLMVWL